MKRKEKLESQNRRREDPSKASKNSKNDADLVKKKKAKTESVGIV
jgi:hypothetical protein